MRTEAVRTTPESPVSSRIRLRRFFFFNQLLSFPVKAVILEAFTGIAEIVTWPPRPLEYAKIHRQTMVILLP